MENGTQTGVPWAVQGGESHSEVVSFSFGKLQKLSLPRYILGVPVGLACFFGKGEKHYRRSTELLATPAKDDVSLPTSSGRRQGSRRPQPRLQSRSRSQRGISGCNVFWLFFQYA